MNKIKIYEASKIIWDANKNENNIHSLPKKLIPNQKKSIWDSRTYKSFTDYKHIGYKMAATSIDG